MSKAPVPEPIEAIQLDSDNDQSPRSPSVSSESESASTSPSFAEGRARVLEADRKQFYDTFGRALGYATIRSAFRHQRGAPFLLRNLRYHNTLIEPELASFAKSSRREATTQRLARSFDFRQLLRKTQQRQGTDTPALPYVNPYSVCLLKRPLNQSHSPTVPMSMFTRLSQPDPMLYPLESPQPELTMWLSPHPDLDSARLRQHRVLTLANMISGAATILNSPWRTAATANSAIHRYMVKNGKCPFCGRRIPGTPNFLLHLRHVHDEFVTTLAAVRTDGTVHLVVAARDEWTRPIARVKPIPFTGLLPAEKAKLAQLRQAVTTTELRLFEFGFVADSRAGEAKLEKQLENMTSTIADLEARGRCSQRPHYVHMEFYYARGGHEPLQKAVQALAAAPKTCTSVPRRKGKRPVYRCPHFTAAVSDELDHDSDDDDEGPWAELVQRQNFRELADINVSERTFMQLWNAFRRRSAHRPETRALLDGRDQGVAAACVAFVNDYKLLLSSTGLARQCQLHMTMLWRLGLLPEPVLQELMSRLAGAPSHAKPVPLANPEVAVHGAMSETRSRQEALVMSVASPSKAAKRSTDEPLADVILKSLSSLKVAAECVCVCVCVCVCGTMGRQSEL
ncbi:uncharacterized protein MONBRDRAFT_25042 [Monosiga brevicollis MX1]|uniref:C2H2-type domain-containing protein n=1 Tax=Monosiga brevicollis TaxID=81824 RepID=A9UXL5_MONBE|nr:uncharacterized protein MONBRDRAFT_25042 [Monosiga brevicollis MX1]EDQ89862.1 predicted protein [Monosiga brevicollis MX1]|eukprot:XP_001745284.1 hypothetical protein [Monosiga brevicollis MX1]